MCMVLLAAKHRNLWCGEFKRVYFTEFSVQHAKMLPFIRWVFHEKNVSSEILYWYGTHFKGTDIGTGNGTQAYL